MIYFLFSCATDVNNQFEIQFPNWLDETTVVENY